MERITLYRVKPPRLDRKRFDSIARSLGIKAEVVEAEDAIAVRDERRTVAYAQPGSKFGGLLFFTDQSVSLGAVSDRLPDARAVKGWADEFLKSHRLLPKAVDKQIEVNRDAGLSDEGCHVQRQAAQGSGGEDRARLRHHAERHSGGRSPRQDPHGLQDSEAASAHPPRPMGGP